MLFVLNFPRVGVWVRILRMPQRYLQVSILLFCIIGAYALRQSSFDVLVMIVFGVFGYVLEKLDWTAVPLVIALIIGPMMERALRAGLELSDGDATVFLTTPRSEEHTSELQSLMRNSYDVVSLKKKKEKVTH